MPKAKKIIMQKNIFKVLASTVVLGAILVACTSNAKTVETTVETTETTAQTTEAKVEETTQAVKVEEVAKNKVYVSPEWVKSVIDGNVEESKDFVIIEAAWGTVADDKAYTEGHIPGAVHMNTDDIESDEFWNYRSADEIANLLKNYGITKDTTVILYGNSPENAADDRIAVAMLWAGVENVKDLSGGIDAWKNAGYDLETTVNEPVATDKDFGTTIPAHPEYTISIDEVKEKIANDSKFKLVSIRSKDEYEGKTSGYGYIDRAGEPLGAVWGHDTDDMSYNNADGTVADLSTVNKYLAESGLSTDKNDIAFYCGTGWRASIPFLIAYENGIKNVSLYDGGWYQWQMDGENPVQVGEPGSSDYQELKVSDLSTDKAKK